MFPVPSTLRTQPGTFYCARSDIKLTIVDRFGSASAHFLLHSKDPAADLAFFNHVLEFNP